MLGKSKIEESGFEPAPVQEPRPGSIGKKTLIGADILIEGNIRGNEDLVIEGSVKGSIELKEHHLRIGPKGNVEADVFAGNITVSGHLIGKITAQEKVVITKDADLNGEIKAKSISVEDGAMLKAAIELERDTPVKAVPKTKPIDMPSIGKQVDQPHLKAEGNKKNS